MPRIWGPTRAYFYELDNVPSGAPVSVSGVNHVDTVVDNSVEWTRPLSGIGSGRASFYATGSWNYYIVPGRICVIEKAVSGYSEIVARTLAIFLVQDVEPITRKDGVFIVNVSGPGVEWLLTRQQVFKPVGHEVITTATLTDLADGPTSLTVAVGAPVGNDSVTLSALTNVDVGDEIRIQMNSTAWHVARVTSIEPPGSAENVIQFAPDLTESANTGNSIEIRSARLPLSSAANMAAGQKVIVTLNSGTFTTTINKVESTSNVIILEAGLTSAANSGKEVKSYDYRGRSTTDVTQIISNAPEWGITFQTGTGTEKGTAHPGGTTVFDALVATAEKTGEFFSYKVLPSGIPTTLLSWRRTPETTTARLIMFDSTADDIAEQDSYETTYNRGTIFSVRKRLSRPVLTRVYPSAGDGQITLAACSTAAVSDAVSQGFAVHISTDPYEPDYVEHTPGVNSSIGVQSSQEVYSDITLGDDINSVGLQTAADQLLLSATQTLLAHMERDEYSVEAYIPMLLHPGQTVGLNIDAKFAGGADETESYTILDVTERLVNGRPRTSFTVSSMTETARPSSTRQAAKLIRTVARSAHIMSKGVSTVRSIASTSTAPTTHDHPEYLPIAGGVSLIGNMPVATGILIDGVDIGAHAASNSAHHPPVTLTNTGLVASGTQNQALGLKLSSSSPGLSILPAGGTEGLSLLLQSSSGLVKDASGLAVSETLAGQGLVMQTGRVLDLNLATNSGMAITSDRLELGPPTTVTATSTNVVSGSGHGHAVTATVNAKTAPNTLLKGDANGDLTARYLTADKMTTPLVTTASGPLSLAPVTDLVIDPAGDVMTINPSTTIRTSHAASGFPSTGWSVAYDGTGNFTSLTADELHVMAFIADTARVKVGQEYITPSMAIIARAFTIPAIGSSSTLYVEDVPGLGNLAAFEEGDWVLLRIIDRSGGGLTVANAWGQVTGYTDRAEGQQSWTFTSRYTSAVGKSVAIGGLALDFGKSGDGWWQVTTLDEAGSPWAGISTWQGSDPYSDGNRKSRVRLGQLRGLTGVNEWGLQAGSSDASFIRFTDIRSEIHGTRLSLYAGDNGELRVAAVEVRMWRTGSLSSIMKPNADHSFDGVSTGGNFYTEVDEGYATASYTDYIRSGLNRPGYVFMGLQEPAAFTSIYRIEVRAAIQSVNLSNDTIRLYAQVFASDELTPLTGEVLVATHSTPTTSSITMAMPHSDYTSASPAEWSGARLRLRWEYDMATGRESIRLDPVTPYIAVGYPLPTDVDSGGNGLWAGQSGGSYKFRLGAAGGQALRWDGANLFLRDSNNEKVIELASDGSSKFAGPMTIGTSGGIWQGTGTFASPLTGLKVYNSAGIGRLSTYNGGLEQVTINSSGQFVTGEGDLLIDRNGLKFAAPSAYRTQGAIRWEKAGWSGISAIYGTVTPSSQTRMQIQAAVGTSQSYLTLESAVSASGLGSVLLTAKSPTETHSLALDSEGATVSTPETIWLTAPTVIVNNGGATSTLKVTHGLVVGDGALADPLGAVIRFKQRTVAVGTPPAGSADLYILFRNNKQELYIKFDDGSGFTLATSTA